MDTRHAVIGVRGKKDGMTGTELADAWRRYKQGGDAKARAAIINQFSYLVKITAGRVVSNIPPSLEREDLADDAPGRELQAGEPAVERRDEGLHDRDGAVGRAGVAPGLQEVSHRDLPVAERGRFILVEAEVHATAEHVLDGHSSGGCRVRANPGTHNAAWDRSEPGCQWCACGLG